MGMYGKLVAIAATDHERLLASPELVTWTLADVATGPEQQTELLRSLVDKFKSVPALVAHYKADLTRLEAGHRGAPARLLRLEKSWDALNQALAGRGSAVERAILGPSGQEYAAQGAFGPPRYLTAAQVAETARAIAGLEPALISQAFAARKITGAHGDYGPADADELRDHWARVVAFYEEAARRGEAIIATVE